MKLIPAIDLREGRCVRLYQGDYDQQTRYDADPVELAASYAVAGVETLHIVDLDGARRGDFANLRAIERMAAATSRTVQCGGGIRERADLERLFDSGVDRAVIGSLAVRDPDLVGGWLGDFGPERICVAFDARPGEGGGFFLTTAGWTETSGLELHAGLRRYEGSGLTHVLCTDITRDGTLEGPNVDLYAELASARTGVAFQASGGVSGLDSLEALATTGAAGAIVGRALLEGRFTVEEAAACLQDV